MKPWMIAMAGIWLAGLGAGATSQEVTLETPTGKLYGTLELPNGSSPFTVALIHPGSGPTDRDGNNPISGQNDGLKMLAQGLAAQGIASLRIDKRGIAKSQGAVAREEDLRFNTYIADSVAWLDWLKQDKRFGKVAVIGHSEGSLIGMVAAQGKADGFVSLAGAGRSAGQILREQLRPQLSATQLTEVERILSELEAGRTVGTHTLPQQIWQALFRPSVQPYMISWLALDPRREIAKLTMPVLIVQGTTDLQVSRADAQQLAMANPKAKLLLLEGMNHILKTAPPDPQANAATYRDPSLPLVKGLLENIVGFLKGL